MKKNVWKKIAQGVILCAMVALLGYVVVDRVRSDDIREAYAYVAKDPIRIAIRAIMVTPT